MGRKAGRGQDVKVHDATCYGRVWGRGVAVGGGEWYGRADVHMFTCEAGMCAALLVGFGGRVGSLLHSRLWRNPPQQTCQPACQQAAAAGRKCGTPPVRRQAPAAGCGRAGRVNSKCRLRPMKGQGAVPLKKPQSSRLDSSKQ